MISNSEIRARAREVLGKGLFTEGWLFSVLVILIVGIINAILSKTYVGPLLVSGILAVASSSYFIARVRGQADPRDLGEAVEGAKNNFTTSFLSNLLCSLFVFIGTIFFIIPGIILSYSYSMIFFVMNDKPMLGPIEVLKESSRLMKGHKWQYFCLHLSFIGWILLGALCFGVGTLWASAYIETASAVFYDELVANDRGYYTVNESAKEA